MVSCIAATLEILAQRWRSGSITLIAKLAFRQPLTKTGYPPVQIGENVVPLTIITAVVACAYERMHAVCHPVIPVYS